MWAPRSAHTVYLCVLYGSQNQLRLLLHLDQWLFLIGFSKNCVYCAARTESLSTIYVNLRLVSFKLSCLISWWAVNYTRSPPAGNLVSAVLFRLPLGNCPGHRTTTRTGVSHVLPGPSRQMPELCLRLGHLGHRPFSTQPFQFVFHCRSTAVWTAVLTATLRRSQIKNEEIFPAFHGTQKLITIFTWTPSPPFQWAVPGGHEFILQCFWDAF